MDSFIAISSSSKEALKIATLSSTLPVNCIIYGPKATGKSHLAHTVAPKAKSYQATKLYELLKTNKIDLNNIDEIIILDIQKVSSVKNFLEPFEQKSIKIIVTSTEYKDSYNELFQVKIELLPLSKRHEDVEFLIEQYTKEAKRVFLIEQNIKPPANIDLSKNAISLKESIYKNILFNSLSKNEIMNLLQEYLYTQLQESKIYKDLLSIFEIPLLKAAQKKYKSQLQMAKQLKINRNTLRKKIIENSLNE